MERRNDRGFAYTTFKGQFGLQIIPVNTGLRYLMGTQMAKCPERQLQRRSFSSPKRISHMPRPQFTLRALLVAMLVVAAFFGGMAVQHTLDRWKYARYEQYLDPKGNGAHPPINAPPRWKLF